MRSLERTRLLIIDDWGPEPLNAEQRRDWRSSTTAKGKGRC
jgi:DNA replication protein DnaC